MGVASIHQEKSFPAPEHKMKGSIEGKVTVDDYFQL